MGYQSHRELLVWQKSMRVVQEVFDATKNLPMSYQISLASQTQRSAVSVPSNIAEGINRSHIKEQLQFLAIAKASAAELETQLLILKDLEVATGLHVQSIILANEEVQKMLFSLVKHISSKRAHKLRT